MSESASSDLPPLYSAVEPLDKERHALLGLVRKEIHYGFSAHANAVPLTAPEFNLALKSFPIIFNSETNPYPVAVLGLKRDQNLFVEPDGKWLPGAYVPLFVRRYPFMFGSVGEGDQFAFCIDPNAAMISDTPDLPLFEDGELTEVAQKGVETCQIFQQKYEATQPVMEKLTASGLLEKREATVTLQDGSDRTLGTYVGVDENRLAELSDEQFLELRRNNLLPFIYMHLASLSNWMRLLELHALRNPPEGGTQAESDEEAPAPAGP